VVTDKNVDTGTGHVDEGDPLGLGRDWRQHMQAGALRLVEGKEVMR
jgi:hypothetical protein